MVSILKKKSSKADQLPRGQRKFIDLNTINLPDYTDQVKTSFKVAEIYRYEDVINLTDYVYGGNIILFDCKPIANDDMLMKRITEEIKSMGRDINGDVAAITKELMILTPKGISIDRNKIRGSY
ncbi:MAG: cell division protein SepF [Candidatus Thermoplasmatota archaeon]|nr:cell division protein SepF [Candidatus Thermoplasmatota archaeon]MCL5793987.1 cell division protein SepF [Candidatus Thermoplasmatota archaeon]